MKSYKRHYIVAAIIIPFNIKYFITFRSNKRTCITPNARRHVRSPNSQPPLLKTFSAALPRGWRPRRRGESGHCSRHISNRTVRSSRFVMILELGNGPDSASRTTACVSRVTWIICHAVRVVGTEFERFVIVTDERALRFTRLSVMYC